MDTLQARAFVLVLGAINSRRWPVSKPSIQWKNELSLCTKHCTPARAGLDFTRRYKPARLCAEQSPVGPSHREPRLCYAVMLDAKGLDFEGMTMAEERAMMRAGGLYRKRLTLMNRDE